MADGEENLLRRDSGDGTGVGRGPRRALLASGTLDTVQVQSLNPRIE